MYDSTTDLSVLHLAVGANSLEMVRTFLSEGAEIDLRAFYWQVTPLMIAVAAETDADIFIELLA